MKNSKRGLLTGKSYIVANAIIRAKEVEDRVIVDQKDVDNLEFMVLNRFDYMGITAKFNDDLKDNIFAGEILRVTNAEETLYMLIPGVDINEFTNDYRENISMADLTHAFKALDNNDSLLRNPEEVQILKAKEAILKEFCSQENIQPVKEKPKQYTYISEK